MEPLITKEVTKASDTSLAITTTTVVVHTLTLDEIASQKADVQTQIDAVRRTIDIGEDTYLATKKGYLAQVADLQIVLKDLDGLTAQAKVFDLVSPVIDMTATSTPIK